MSHLMIKPTKWHVCPPKDSDQPGHLPSRCPDWSESSLAAQWVAKDPSLLHADSNDSDQTGWMPRLIWVFAGSTGNFVGFVMRQLKSEMLKINNRCPEKQVCQNSKFKIWIVYLVLKNLKAKWFLVIKILLVSYFKLFAACFTTNLGLTFGKKLFCININKPKIILENAFSEKHFNTLVTTSNLTHFPNYYEGW